MAKIAGEGTASRGSPIRSFNKGKKPGTELAVGGSGNVTGFMSPVPHAYAGNGMETKPAYGNTNGNASRPPQKLNRSSDVVPGKNANRRTKKGNY